LEGLVLVDWELQPERTTAFDLGFQSEGEAAYVDGETFLALADNGTSSVVDSKWVKSGPWYDPHYEQQTNTFSGANINHTSPVPNGGFASLPNAPLCEECAFLRYGLWSSDVTYGDKTDKMGGWWVATDRPVSETFLRQAVRDMKG